MSGPSVADDEAALASYATELSTAIRAALGGWVIRSIRLVADEQGRALDDEAARTSAVAAEACRREVGDRVDHLLSLDIDEQRTNPMQLLRDAVVFPTGVLDELGAEAVRRDRFAVEAFPDDRYDLTPATFADVDPALHDVGIRWGAAKAHVHLQRHRSAS